MRRLFLAVTAAGLRPGLADALARRVVITNKIAVTIAAIGIPYILIFGAVGAAKIALWVTSSTLCYAAVPLMNRLGWLNASRVAMVLIGNAMTFFVTLQVGQAAATDIYFFAMMALPLILFDPAQRLTVAGLACLPVALMVLLETTGILGVTPMALPSAGLYWIKILTILATAASLLAAMAFFMSVTSRAAATATTEKDKLNSIFRSVEDTVFLLDDHRRCVAVNDRVRRYGFEPDVLVGRTIFDVQPKEEAEAYDKKCRQALETGQSVSFLQSYAVSSDLTYWFKITLTPARNAASKTVGMVGVARDVTSERRHEAELRRAHDAANAASTAKTYFLANISHELRTPITAILGFAELMATDGQNLNLDRADYLARILRNGRHLNALIGDILDVTRIETGKLQLELRPVDATAAVGRVVEEASPAARNKGLALTFTREVSLPSIVVCDSLRLYQVLSNLVGNAIKFTARGGVEVHIDTADAGKLLVIKVTDTGVGIAPEHRSVLFEPFSQGDPSTGRHFGGTGLGLALSRELARAMGGEVTLCDSVLGQGSTFALTLPFGIAARPTTTTAAPLEPIDLTGIRVLVVDDTADMRLLVAEVLAPFGARIDTAANGQTAIAMASTEQYSVILMDIQMPGMDGYATTRRLRASDIKTPIVALTGRALAGERAACLAAGCDDYVAKPVGTEGLKRIVKLWAFGLSDNK